MIERTMAITILTFLLSYLAMEYGEWAARKVPEHFESRTERRGGMPAGRLATVPGVMIR